MCLCESGGLTYVFPKYRDKSVRDENSFRVEIGKRQQLLPPVDTSEVERLCQQFFKDVGMEDIALLKRDLLSLPIKRGFYHQLKVQYHLLDKRDIIWIKFTRSGHIGVVANSADINLSLDNTSGRIITFLEEVWDDSVFIFPLSSIPDGWDKHRLESGLGNYSALNLG